MWRGSNRRNKKRQEILPVLKMEMEEGTQFLEVETKPRGTIFTIHSKKKVKCQRLPKNIKKSLKSKIHWTIIAILYEFTEDYNETEKHLNILKERLLKCIKTLEVPVDELNYLTNVQSVLKKEEKKYILMEEYLEHLEAAQLPKDMKEYFCHVHWMCKKAKNEEITNNTATLHTLDENIQEVQKEIKALTCELTTLEAEANKLFHRDASHDLGLPDLPMEYFKLPVLQDEVLKIGNPHALLYDMNIIQQSDEMKNMMAFLEQLYEKADHQCKEKQ